LIKNIHEFTSNVIHGRIRKKFGGIMKVEIEKLDYEGRGLTHRNGKVMFVPRALPKEKIEIELEKEEKNYDLAKVTKILEKNEKRIPSYCPYASHCGGCTFDFLPYEETLRYKKEIIKDLFQKNNISVTEFEIVPSRPVLGYRNKISLKVENGKIGYYEEKSHRLIEIKECLLVNEAILGVLKDFPLFKFQNGTLTIRSNEEKECLIIIETKEKLKIKEDLINRHKIKGIIWNKKIVYKDDYLKVTKENTTYKISYEAFYQVNPYISEKIVEEIKPQFKKEDTFFDLYCGVGFFGLRFAKNVKKVIGIESNKEAVLSAVENAKLNQLENVSFHIGKVEDILKKIPIDSKKVLVDPPRSGLKKSVISCFKENKIEKIIYISCNPITLVRDLKLLLEEYTIIDFKCFDMFPYTKHLETMTILKRKEGIYE